MRIDKFLANLWLITRKYAKKIFKLWNIFINWEAIFNESQKINQMKKVKTKTGD